MDAKEARGLTKSAKKRLQTKRIKGEQQRKEQAQSAATHIKQGKMKAESIINNEIKCAINAGEFYTRVCLGHVSEDYICGFREKLTNMGYFVYTCKHYPDSVGLWEFTHIYNASIRWD